jgi:ATP-binding cassette subfamily F protein 3
MITLKGVTLRRGARVLLDNTSVTINTGERVGLIGRNGAGKSTLFALLDGSLHEDAGEFFRPAQWRLAQVLQEMPETSQSATDFVISGDSTLLAAEEEVRLAEESGDGEDLAHAYMALHDAGAHDAQARAQALILGLGFKTTELNNPVDSFSGGWRMRLQLARALMCPSDLLLLDEPTNHLDLDALVWLESWLTRYEGTMLVISHDREFLDAISTVTLHLDNEQLTRYGGNYSVFEETRAQQLELQQNAYAKQQDKIAHLQSFISRFKAKATKAKQAQSRVKALERIERLAPVLANAEFSFEFKEGRQPAQPDADHGRRQLRLPGAGRCRRRHAADGDRPPGHALGARWPAHRHPGRQRAGQIDAGEDHRPRPELYQWHHQRRERPAHRLLRAAGAGRPTTRRNTSGTHGTHGQGGTAQTARAAASRICAASSAPSTSAGDMVKQAVGTMSGGEKARLVLCMIVWQRPNLLLLDEPTNHLDLGTREALSIALNEFEGTVMLVSHDRSLLRSVCDEFWLVSRGGVADFTGDLDDYQRYLLDEAKRSRDTLKKSLKSAKEPRQAAASVSTTDNRKAPGTLKALARDQGRIEKELLDLQKEQHSLESRLSNPLAAADLAALGARMSEIAEQLANWKSTG